jgi:hypothetical protein
MKTTIEIEVGTAHNTAAAQQWLNSCDAVIEWTERDDATIEFRYDASAEVSAVPHFVRF